MTAKHVSRIDPDDHDDYCVQFQNRFEFHCPTCEYFEFIKKRQNQDEHDGKSVDVDTKHSDEWDIYNHQPNLSASIFGQIEIFFNLLWNLTSKVNEHVLKKYI